MPLLDRWEEGREGRDEVTDTQRLGKGGGNSAQLIHVPDLLSVEDIIR